MSNSRYNIYTLDTLPKTRENTSNAERLGRRMLDDDSFNAEGRFMRCSELISHLDRLMSVNGDLPIMINSEDIGFVMGFNAFVDIMPVSPNHTTKEKLDALEAIRLEISTNYTHTT